MKFSVSKNRSFFIFFKYVEILFNKHASIDVDITAADIMQLFSNIMPLAYFLDIKAVSTPPT